MTYVKISNRGVFHRKYLEIISLSSKRERADDPAVIGNKGSGTKLAAIAALRLGLDLAISSTDDEGTYLLQFELRKVRIAGRDVRQIFFVYDPAGVRLGKPRREVVPSSMIIEAF